jgi:hypothetical protein
VALREVCQVGLLSCRQAVCGCMGTRGVALCLPAPVQHCTWPDLCFIALFLIACLSARRFGGICSVRVLVDEQTGRCNGE